MRKSLTSDASLFMVLSSRIRFNREFPGSDSEMVSRMLRSEHIRGNEKSLRKWEVREMFFRVRRCSSRETSPEGFK
jgi:hypothetical protein